MSGYSVNFYSELEKSSSTSAKVLVPILVEKFHPASVIDFGCGGGSFVRQFLLNGIQDATGVEGEWILDVEHLASESWLQVRDLKKPIRFERKFDLAVCLEVAEHLPAEFSRILVETLVSASDRIVFSAAIPGQSGTDHINLQFPEYWAHLFKEYGYFLEWDPRPSIWNTRGVAPWYQQNLLIYRRFTDQGKEIILPPQMFHPEIFPEHASLYYKTRFFVRRVIRRLSREVRIASSNG
jgi:hypothetical protein